jgi:hypothetical protein
MQHNRDGSLKRGLRVFQNTVLTKICEAQRDEVTGKRGGLHNEELNDLYSSNKGDG